MYQLLHQGKTMPLCLHKEGTYSCLSAIFRVGQDQVTPLHTTVIKEIALLKSL